MRTEAFLAVLWVLLALATLALVIDSGHALAAALTAWTGGLITQQLYTRFLT